MTELLDYPVPPSGAPPVHDPKLNWLSDQEYLDRLLEAVRREEDP